MAGFDLNEEADKVSEAAGAATEKLELAGDEVRDRAATDVAIGEDKASEAVGRFRKMAETAHENAAEHWKETRERWHAQDGGTGKPAAADPIDFADPSVDEAEEGVLDVLDERAGPKPPAS